jgi:hypothetical protein
MRAANILEAAGGSLIPFSRILISALAVSCFAYAAPPLTLIQDVLYKADGSRFNGIVSISWSSFEASDQSQIATQITTVKVIDGNFRVQLVPTTNATPAGNYTATYNSDGRIQFTETWAVPPSAQALRIRDVRVAPGAVGGDTTPTTPLQESDVVGLIGDLGARPVKGPAFAAGRVAMVNPLGALDSVVGSPSDCVRVDGSSGPCGSPSPSFIDGDIPSGIVDGANTQFSLSATPSPASSLAVYRNGLLMALGVDYSVNDRTLLFLAASTPTPGDTLLATYRIASAGNSSAQPFPSPQVLCSATGGSTSAAAFNSLATCVIPPGTLLNGDRVEIRFDLEHQGAASGFAMEVHWGGTTVLHRDGAASDVRVSGNVHAGLFTGGTQISTQSWGTYLPFSATVGNASDDYAGGLLVDFEGKLTQAGESIVLRNYAVVRLP